MMLAGQTVAGSNPAEYFPNLGEEFQFPGFDLCSEVSTEPSAATKSSGFKMRPSSSSSMSMASLATFIDVVINLSVTVAVVAVVQCVATDWADDIELRCESSPMFGTTMISGFLRSEGLGEIFGRDRQPNFPVELFPAVSGKSCGAESRKFGTGLGESFGMAASLRTERA